MKKRSVLMRSLFTFIMVITPISLLAMNGPVSPPIEATSDLFKEVAPGVYAGQTKVGNEIVYFGMERLDQENLENWNKYKTNTRYKTQEGRGIFHVLALQCIEKIFPPFIKMQQRTGFADETEYLAYRNKVCEAVDKNANIPAAIAGIPGGIMGFMPDDTGDYYVVYASRKPINGRFPFAKDIPSSISLTQYYSFYQDILMSVGSENEKSTNKYENRGIFKNPISFIEDGDKYPGLSLKLHGFSAAVASHIFKNKQYMFVIPVPAMTRVLLGVKGWQRGDFLIDDKDLNDYSPGELEAIKIRSGPPISVGVGEPRIHIKIDALMKLYSGA